MNVRSSGRPVPECLPVRGSAPWRRDLWRRADRSVRDQSCVGSRLPPVTPTGTVCRPHPGHSLDDTRVVTILGMYELDLRHPSFFDPTWFSV